MDRSEAKAIYERGEEAVIEKLIEMDARLTAFERRNAELATNSTNSSKPPSSDGPQVPRQTKPPSRRRQGGQKGHRGTHRELLPSEEMDVIKDLRNRSANPTYAAS